MENVVFGTVLKAWGNRCSLRLLLITVVVLAVLAVVGTGTWVDYHREYHVHVDEVLASLGEQTYALSDARKQMPDPAVFSAYVDDFCAQMNDFVSPGHHVLVLDSDGKVVASSSHHSGAEVEQALMAADPNEPLLAIQGHRLAQVRLRNPDGTTLILAQYMDHTEEILRAQLISRAVTAAAVSIALIVLLYVLGFVLKVLG